MTTTETKKYFSNPVSEKTDNMKKTTSSERPFNKTNFILMGACLLMIVVGFLLMCGSGSSVEGGFNPDIFSVRRIVIGPTLAFLGFLLMAFAIIWTPGKNKTKTTDAGEAVASTDDSGQIQND